MRRDIEADAMIARACQDRERQHLESVAKHTPSIDLVRCKECRHRNERCGMGEHRWCEMLNMSTTPDDYCSYGEREGE